MTYYAETLTHAGFGIRIYGEEYIEPWMSPREDDDGLLGAMFCAYRGYTLGDDDAPDPRGHEIECPHCDGDDDACSACGGHGYVEESIVDYLKREHGARVILPLFVYEHSGITMSCGGRLDKGEDDFSRTGRNPFDSAGWDTSSVGVIFDTAESRTRCGWENRTDDEIEEDLRNEVRAYAAYLENQVYGWEVVRLELDEDGEPEDIESADDVVDGVGGYLVVDYDFSDLLMEAKSSAEHYADADERERNEAFRWACADVVTL